MAGPTNKTPFEPLARAIARLALLSSRHAKTALIVVLVVTLGLGFGVTKLNTNVDVADVLPRGNYNTTAAKQLTVDFKSAFTQQVTLQFSVNMTGDFSKWRADNERFLEDRQTAETPGNITDEVYVRAIQQFTDYMLEHTDFANVISIAELYNLANWTVAGGQNASDDAFHMPSTSPQGEREYANAKTIAENTPIIEAIDALVSPDWRTTAVLITPSPDEELDLAELGAQAIEWRNRYLSEAQSNPDFYKSFTPDVIVQGAETPEGARGNMPLFTVELPIANAHSAELVKEDFSRLLPIIGLFILVVLFIAFRNIGSMLIAFASLAIGVLWTYGAEGYLGIALNPLNLTLMPLIMGVGIDYSIHVVNEFLEHKAQGFTDERAFQETGRRAGVALFIATLVTTLGLLVMVISPSILIAQFGALAALSIISIFLVALIFIPAALTLYPGTAKMGQTFKPSELMAHVARGITKVRWLALAVVLLGAIVGAVAAQNLHFESFGDPGRNYLADDPIREEHEEGLRRFYDDPNPNIKANVIAFVGDVTTPESHSYMRAIEDELRNPPPEFGGLVITDTLRTIPFLMETWLTVKDGAPGAGLFILQEQFQEGAAYPDSQQEIKEEFDALYSSPMRRLGSIFTNGPDKDYSIGTMTFSVKAGNYTEAVAVWDAVWTAIQSADDTHGRPDGLRVAFVGNTATNYLFVKEEVPYLYYMGALGTLGLMVVAAAFFRTVRAVITVGIVSFATTSVWLGILPEFGIGLAITLVLPLIFIIALGTDYTVHLLWSNRVVGDLREVFRTVGKAILFSFLTTLGPFVIFIGIQDLSVRKTMLATAIAIFFIFVITILTVPALYPVRAREPPEPKEPTEVDVPQEPEEPKLVAVKRPKSAS